MQHPLIWIYFHILKHERVGTGRSAACGHENAVVNKEFSLPCTAVVGAQVDKIPSIDGGILHSKGTAANGVYTLMPQGWVADGGIGVF